MIRGIEAITFDFGNTLVSFPARDRDAVLSATADVWAARFGATPEAFVVAWYEERQRQFAEDVPEGREANMDVRVARVLARLAGEPAPPAGQRWDDGRAAALTSRTTVDAILDTYADAFVKFTDVPPTIGPMLARLATRYRLGLLSNWPWPLPLERYLVNAGWAASLSSVVVSARVGSIKPGAEIFRVAARELGLESGPALLHVGDDPGADVVGAHAAGWRAAWVRVKPEDSPLPAAPPVADPQPDIVVDRVEDIERALGLTGPECPA